MKFKKHFCLFILLLALNGLFAQESEEAHFTWTRLSYGYDLNTVNRFSMSLEEFIASQLYLEIPLTGFSYIKNDPFNHDKKNYSLYQTVGPAAMALAGSFIGKGDSLEVFSPAAFVVLHALLNSNLNYTINTKAPYNKGWSKEFYESGMAISIFAKTNTDWFMLKNNNWVQLSPGLGVKMYFGDNIHGYTLIAGYQRAYQFPFSGKPRQEDMAFLQIGFGGLLLVNGNMAD